MSDYIDSIKSVMIDLAESNFSEFEKLGHAVEGHNGPYGHSDTPVRNTCHWCIIFGYLWKITQEERYYSLMNRFADYICSIQRESESGAIECMTTDLFDHLNGLIGQAWAIEALTYAYKATCKKEYLHTAKRIYLSQKYDRTNHLWQRIELDGQNIGYDYTFNHQLYFAAAASMISDCEYDEQLENIISDFLEGTLIHFNINDDGRICHYVSLPRPAGRKYYLRKIIKTIGQPLKVLDPNAFNLDNHEIGYHLFDMYIFALLYKKYYSLAIFHTDKFKKALDYALDIDSLNKSFNSLNFQKLSQTPLKRFVKLNKFSYAYNSPAFELPYIAKVFDTLDTIDCEKLWEFQLNWLYDKSKHSFSRNNLDTNTLNARIYEIIPFIEN